MSSAKTIHGRIVLADRSQKFSKLGVFEDFQGEKYINLETLDTGKETIAIYLPYTPENSNLVNQKLGPGEVVSLQGNYKILNQRKVFLAEEIHSHSRCATGRKSKIFGLSEQSRSAIQISSGLLSKIRRQFETEGFLEVSTPILLPFYEGGDATPFKTHDKEGKPLYLKETNELILRRLISLGSGKVYEIGKSFRNIGLNSRSLNEFTVVESAIPFANLDQGIAFSERLIKNMLSGFDQHASQLEENWPRVYFEERYKALTSHDYVPSLSYSQDRKDLEKLLSSIKGPAFLIGLPFETSPINKKGEKTLKEAVLTINGSVFCDICEFETNPQIIQERLQRQADRTGSKINQSFLEFSLHGLVPGVGIAYGLERWINYLTGLDVVKAKSLGGII